MVFAVKQATGLKSITDIRDRKFPLKLSLRGQPDHSLQVIINHVCAAAGFTLDDIVSWGGEVRFDAGMPYGQNRIGAVHRGEIDAIFDEGASAWGNMALDLGMTFLSLPEAILQRLEAVGLRRGLIEKKSFPKLSADVPTLDFSGWPIYTLASTPDALGARLLPRSGGKQSADSLGQSRAAADGANGSRQRRRSSRSAAPRRGGGVLARAGLSCLTRIER